MNLKQMRVRKEAQKTGKQRELKKRKGEEKKPGNGR